MKFIEYGRRNKLEIKTKEVSGIASAVYDMRKPMESIGDSEFVFEDGLKLLKLGQEDEKLLRKLGRAKGGSGHDCVLKDIVVHMDITATHDFLLQFYRYHYRDTASSTSKMHSIHKGSIGDKCSAYVSQSTISIVNHMILFYNDMEPYDVGTIAECCRDYWEVEEVPEDKKQLFECIIHNTPIGYELSVGGVTNYLQLKSMWNQRKNHKMSSWSVDFVAWIRSLPMSYLITGEEN